MRKQNYRKRVSRRPRGKKAIIRKALSSNWKKSVASVCKKVIARQSEIKIVTQTYGVSPVASLRGVADFSLYNIIQVSPGSLGPSPIVGGYTQDERIGNEIMTKYCKGNMIITPKSYNVTNNVNPSPSVVTVWCVSPRSGYLSQDSMATLFNSTFFQSGGLTAGYASRLTDTIAQLNKDKLQVHWKRVYKIGHSTQYSAPNQSVPESVNQAQWANNDFKMNAIVKYDFTKAMSRIYKFNDVQTQPENKNTYLIFGVARADGQQYISTNYAPVDIYLETEYGYTDM